MFSETRYARNGDLRIAYRASREGPRDIVFVSNWFTCCEVAPELPSIQGWVEAMTSLGRLIFFDQPGTGASDPVTPDAMPNMEQWADSITAVLDDLGSSEAVLLAVDGAFATAALFAATHPSRTTALIALEGYADAADRTVFVGDEALAAMVAMWGTGEFQHLLNPDMPWNEEIRASWARQERLAANPRTVALMFPLTIELNVRAVLLLAGLSVVVPLFAVVLYLVLPNLDFLVVHNVVLISFIGIFAVYRVSQRSRDVSIGLTTHSVSVNEGSGAVFPQMDAKLGQWAGQGTALHLRNADRRFVLGGRQYAVPTGARLDAKPVYSVDASMPAAAFHTLLNNIIYRQY